MAKNPIVIALDEPASPAILAGLLGINVAMVYQAKQDGKLPSDPDASYRDCILQYVKFYKDKITGRGGDLYEQKLRQEVRNGLAKEELQWLEIKRIKSELVDINSLNELLLPIIHIVKSNLMNIARKFPETTQDIDRTLETWAQLGEKIYQKSKIESIKFVQDKLEEELEYSYSSDKEAEDEIYSKFNLD